jgi:hAT family C-terminal dimerisation region
MAQDYLAIQGSATPSERAFSSGGLTGTKNRNCLNGAVFENLQLLKSAYRNGHISAASDAKQHIDSLIASFDVEEEDGEDVF